MLSDNKPLMTTALNELLTPSAGNPVYDAAYNAYYTANRCDLDAVSKDLDPTGLSNIAANSVNTLISNRAKDFATEFCNNLQKSKFMDSIADEIDKHIKSMMITINIPSLLPTIISPTGPCTGALTISKETGAQIIIS